MGNDIYKLKIINSVAEIKNGIALSDTLKNETKYFPNLLVNMIAVGEKTGTLEYVLKTFADFYEEEVDNALKELTTYLEPIMLLVMGVVIGAIALSILLPIYQLVGKFT
jgi:type II secretory pathway component PulF